ncbi:hypothetical protein AXF42_Ash015271 [Apostasia shenzhenica]|uniref:SWIM-type domain-containing protein n=1 Tax=Apostasia shenzhenica TaxID=1088818 RepID=A0A2I0ALQ5_9ASPA|nr:hypothetical protein AXF42_Ash015271 [Apostasia shenzhenica]
MFADKETLKDALIRNAVKEKFRIKAQYSEKKRLIVICSVKECPWRINAIVDPKYDIWRISKFNNEHKCALPRRKSKELVTSSWVANLIKEFVREHPETSLRQLRQRLKQDYGLNLTYMKLWRSREIARKIVFGEVEDSYQQLPIFYKELLQTYTGSHIILDYSLEDFTFQRFFLSFKACVEGFIKGCRPLIGLNACHLKGKYLGMLISATALDGNRQLYPIAYAVVEGENKGSWQWFVSHLKHALGNIGENVAFISDMEKGIDDAVRTKCPRAEHRLCMRHLWKNLKKTLRVTEWKFHEIMTEIEVISPNLYAYLCKLNCKWARKDFNPLLKSKDSTNNMSESFNSWISQHRAKNVIDLIDSIRVMILQQRNQRKQDIARWQNVLVPSVMEQIREMNNLSSDYSIKEASPTLTEVEGKGERHRVDLASNLCSCEEWQLTGIPCIHATVFIGTLDIIDWNLYVSAYFHVSR